MADGTDRAATVARRQRVGAALRRRREQLGLRISRLPAGFPVHYRRLSRIETGVAVLDAGELAVLLFALDWTQEDLDAEAAKSGVLGALPPTVAAYVPPWAAEVDWHLTDAAIGREIRLSRARVGHVRARLIELGQPVLPSAKK